DCHTPGFAQNGGATPPSEWLTGDALGWNGPWGTSYAANLRLRLSQMNEREWLSYARGLNARPPMPNGILHAMTDADLRAIWRFVRFPGATGTPAPSALPPGVEPVGPVVRFPTSPVAG
ncbi:MAG: cytochrome C, partial [Tahibacter sp.]